MSRAAKESTQALSALAERWQRAWPDALAAWSRFTRLGAPLLCTSAAAAKREGLQGSFAMIRLSDQAVVVSLPEVAANGLQDFAVEILAHEIGHHVYAPATLLDHGRMIARMRAALPTVERHAPMLANLYTDLLINDRLQRSARLRMAEVYQALLRHERGSGAVWRVYLRIYEILWSLPRGALAGGALEDRMEGDAWLGARLLRSYARDWVRGSGRFAALFLPYVLEDRDAERDVQRLLDTRGAGAGGDPSGLTDADPDELSGAIHPALDPELAEDGGDGAGDETLAELPPAPAPGAGQTRQPFEYGELLRALGLQLNDHDVAVRYYRERALPHLMAFPRRERPESREPLLEGLEPWDIGQPLDALDMMQSVLVSPQVIPGMSTVQRTWGTSEGSPPAPEPLDLDLYVDSSGSMPNPQRLMSFPTLAGAIVCLSALRAGARVQATLWSGKHQFTTTPGFVRDEQAVLRVLTGFFGGATAFPIHVLRETYAQRPAGARPAHVLVISDDGVSTMFDQDERGESGYAVAERALARAQGGATFVLNLPADWDAAGAEHHGYYGSAFAAIHRAREELGVAVHRVASWEDLVAFAREFSRKRYGGER